MRAPDGYSLLELLIVVTLIALISITAASFLFTSLSGTGKASVVAVIKQNGDHALGVIEREIRAAQFVDCGAGNSLILSEGLGTKTNLDDETTTLAIVANRINIRVDKLNPPSTTAKDLTSERIVAENFSCTIIPGTLESPDVAKISFVLRVGAPGVDRPSEVNVQQFETRVGLRRYTY